MNLIKLNTKTRLALGATSLLLAGAAQAGVLASWTFQNAANNKTSDIEASSTATGVRKALFNTDNNGVENWSGNKLSVTRYFDSKDNTPWLSFTLDNTVENLKLSFTHFHNHNWGFPTQGQYKFGLQLDQGKGFHSVAGAQDLIASSATSGQNLSIDLAASLGPGSYSVRWVGYGFRRGDNSNTEFFALDNVTLSGSNKVPEPASFALVGLALAGGAVARRRQQRG